MANCSDVRLDGFEYRKDLVGYIVEVDWTGGIEEGGEGGKGPNADLKFLFETKFRSLFRYDWDGQYVGPLVDTVRR